MQVPNDSLLGVMSKEGHVMPPHFFLQGFKINATAYIKVLDTGDKFLIKGMAQGRPYLFQQNCSLSHAPPISRCD